MGTAPPAELLKVAGVNVSVKLQTDEQDMEIRPGDYLIADINGVVVLPVELAEKALPLMQKQVEVSSRARLPFTGELNGRKYYAPSHFQWPVPISSLYSISWSAFWWSVVC